jgi:hypothetical protein
VAGNFEFFAENSVIAFGTGGAALESYGDDATLTCCDLYGNEGGDWVGNIADQFGESGNIALDPRFCDADGGDWSLAEDSPCAPEANPACELIGAWPVGCGPTAIAPTSWGSLKARFR